MHNPVIDTDIRGKGRGYSDRCSSNETVCRSYNNNRSSVICASGMHADVWKLVQTLLLCYVRVASKSMIISCRIGTMFVMQAIVPWRKEPIVRG